jgi:hypothetical protein
MTLPRVGVDLPARRSWRRLPIERGEHCLPTIRRRAVKQIVARLCANRLPDCSIADDEYASTGVCQELSEARPSPALFGGSSMPTMTVSSQPCRSGGARAVAPRLRPSIRHARSLTDATIVILVAMRTDGFLAIRGTFLESFAARQRGLGRG